MDTCLNEFDIYLNESLIKVNHVWFEGNMEWIRGCTSLRSPKVQRYGYDKVWGNQLQGIKEVHAVVVPIHRRQSQVHSRFFSEIRLINFQAYS